MAFRIHGEVSLDGAMFKRGLNQISGESAAFVKNFALGAVGVYSIEQAFAKTVEKANELVDASDRLGASVEQLQILRQAAKDGGVELDALTSAIGKYNVARENALKGDKSILAAFQRLGIGREQLQVQTASDSIMNQISTTVRGSNAADIAKELRDVFGKSGNELFGVLGTDFSELENRMRKMGALMDQDTAVKLDYLGDQLSLVAQIITSTLAPALLQMAQWVLQLTSSTGGNVAGIAAELGDLSVQFSRMVRDQQDSIDWKQNDAAGAAARQPWQIMLEKMQSGMESAAINAKNRREQSAVDADTKVEKIRASRSDSLVSTGNFLGAGRGAISDLTNQRLLAAAQAQINEQKITNKYLENLAEKIGQKVMQAVVSGDWAAN